MVLSLLFFNNKTTVKFNYQLYHLIVADILSI
jgi:hypothetical protein